MDLKHTIIRVFAANVATTILGILGLVILARALGPTDLGVFLLFQAVIGILGSITDFGIHGAVEKRVSEGKHDNIFSTGIVIQIGLLFLISLVILSFTGEINKYIGANVALLLIPAIIIEQVGKLLSRALSGELEVAKVETSKAGRHSLFIILAILLISLDNNVYNVIYSYIFSWIIFSIWISKSLSASLKIPTVRTARSILSFSKYNLIASIISGEAYGWLDVLFIGFFLTNAHVSSYEIAWRIAGMVLILSKSITRPLFPQVSYWYANSNMETIENILPKVLSGSLIVVFPAIIGSILFGQELLTLVFGSEYAMAYLPLIILIAGKIPEAINSAFGKVLLGLNRPDLVAICSTIFIVSMVVTNLLLIKPFGIVGVAIATSLSILVNMTLLFLYLNKILTIRIEVRIIVTMVSSSFIMGLLLAIINIVLEIKTIFTLTIAILFGASIYFGLMLCTTEFRNRVKELYNP